MSNRKRYCVKLNKKYPYRRRLLFLSNLFGAKHKTHTIREPGAAQCTAHHSANILPEHKSTSTINPFKLVVFMTIFCNVQFQLFFGPPALPAWPSAASNIQNRIDIGLHRVKTHKNVPWPFAKNCRLFIRITIYALPSSELYGGLFVDLVEEIKNSPKLV